MTSVAVDLKEEPNTYWFVFSGIEAYKALVKKWMRYICERSKFPARLG